MVDEVSVDVATASEDLLLSCTMADLRGMAMEIGVKVSGKTRTQLVKEIIETRDTVPRPDDPPKPDESAELAPQQSSEPVEDEDEITLEEARQFDNASDDEINSWLKRRSAEARLCLTAYAYLVLKRREDARKEAELKESLQSQIEQYEVTKGGRIAVNGFWTNLPVGSVVAPHTHDLLSLRAQGIEMRRIRKVVAEPDDVGRYCTKIEL